MEIKKEYYYLLLLLLIVLVFWGVQRGWFSFREQPETAFVFPSERAEKFGVSSGSSLPAFTQQLIIDPYRVYQGEKQVFSVWAKDEQGIESVVAEIYTDRGVESFNLELVEEDEKMGRWQGQWITKDLELQDVYSFSLTAVSKEGKRTTMTPTFEVKR